MKSLSPNLALFAVLVCTFAFAPLVTAQLAIAQEETKSTTEANQTQKDDKPDKEKELVGSQWVTMTPTGAGASFEAPIKPRYVERSFSPVEGKPPIKVHLHLATTNQGKSTFIFGYHDLHEEPKDAKEIDAALNGAVKGSVANVFGQLVGKVARIRFKQAVGRQYVYRYQQTQKVPNSDKEVGKMFIVTSRVFLLGQRQYQISCLMENSIFDEHLAL